MVDYYTITHSDIRSPACDVMIYCCLVGESLFVDFSNVLNLNFLTYGMNIKAGPNSSDTDAAVVQMDSSAPPSKFILKIEIPSCEFPLWMQWLCSELD